MFSYLIKLLINNFCRFYTVIYTHKAASEYHLTRRMASKSHLNSAMASVCRFSRLICCESCLNPAIFFYCRFSQTACWKSKTIIFRNFLANSTGRSNYDSQSSFFPVLCRNSQLIPGLLNYPAYSQSSEYWIPCIISSVLFFNQKNVCIFTSSNSASNWIIVFSAFPLFSFTFHFPVKPEVMIRTNFNLGWIHKYISV